MPPPPRKRPSGPGRPDSPDRRSADRPPWRKDQRGEFPAKRPGAWRRGSERPAEGEGGERGWDAVAVWYDKLVGTSGSDYHRQLILPAAVDLLAVQRGERVLDLCCGQGVLIHLLLKGGAEVTGIDASPQLIQAARRHLGPHHGLRLLVADATGQAPWADGSFDAAACIMAVHDVENAPALFSNIAASLRPGGRAVVILLHPCFRIPRQTHWGWDEDRSIQYRRLDRYASPLTIPIATHPGRDAGPQTQFHHRSLGDLLGAMGRAGLAVTDCRELCSHRRSQAGPRSRAEHRAAEEFPVFLALKAVRI